jgi:hypothetical protein
MAEKMDLNAGRIVLGVAVAHPTSGAITEQHEFVWRAIGRML